MMFYHGQDRIWVPGPRLETRSDGSSQLIVSQAYGSDLGVPEGGILTDEVGQNWKATHPIKEGFYIEGMILEITGGEDAES